VLEGKIVALVICAGIRKGRGEAIYPHCTIITGSGKVFVGRIKGDALDMTLVLRKRLELFESVA